MNKGLVIVIVVIVVLTSLGVLLLIPAISDSEPVQQFASEIPRMAVDENFELDDLFTEDVNEEFEPEPETEVIDISDSYSLTYGETTDILGTNTGKQATSKLDSLYNVIYNLKGKIDSLEILLVAYATTPGVKKNQTKAQRTTKRSRPKSKSQQQVVQQQKAPPPGSSRGITMISESQSIATSSPGGNTISAQVYGDYPKLRNNDRIRFITNHEAIINGKIIPANTVIYGTTNLNRTHMEVRINSIPYRDTYINANIQVFTPDGEQGFRILNAVNQEAAEDAANRTAQNVGVNLPLGLGHISKDVARRKIEDSGIEILNAKPVVLRVL